METEVIQKEIISVFEAADLLGVDPKTIRNWVNYHGAPCAKLGGLLRFRRSSLMAWVEKREQETMAERRG